MDEAEVLAAEAKNHEFAGLEASLDQVEIRVRLVGVEETIPADQVGADLVGAAPVLADVELQVDRRRLGGVADRVDDAGDGAARAVDRAKGARGLGIGQEGDPEGVAPRLAGEIGDALQGAGMAAAEQDVAEIGAEAAEVDVVWRNGAAVGHGESLRVGNGNAGRGLPARPPCPLPARL